MTDTDQFFFFQKKQVPNEVGLLDQLQINLYTILYHLSVVSCPKSREEIIYSEASKHDITYIIKVLGDNYRTKTTTME